MALTGYEAEAGPIDLNPASEARELIIRMLTNAAGPTETESITAVSKPAGEPAAPPTAPVGTDDEVIYRVQKTPKGKALWSGDTGGYPSPSEADAALMTILADRLYQPDDRKRVRIRHKEQKAGHAGRSV